MVGAVGFAVHNERSVASGEWRRDASNAPFDAIEVNTLKSYFNNRLQTFWKDSELKRNKI